MKAAVVTQAGLTPAYADFQEPTAGDGDFRITVSAAALSHVTRGRASGRHYSASTSYPFAAGLDGVGTLDNGKRVYFILPEAPFGSLAERSVAKQSHCVDVPDALDDVTAAAIAIPGMSSWAALAERARLVKGETVLVNGATGTSGRLAVQIAKYLGAANVIATGRNADVLRSLAALGADVTIALTQDKETFEAQLREHFHGGVGVVLDYLWGESAETILRAAAKAAPEAIPIRFVQIGAIAASDIALPGAVLRSSSIELMGSGIGSIPMQRMFDTIGRVLAATGPANLKIATTAVPLSNVADWWTRAESTNRVVFKPASGD